MKKNMKLSKRQMLDCDICMVLIIALIVCFLVNHEGYPMWPLALVGLIFELIATPFLRLLERPYSNILLGVCLMIFSGIGFGFRMMDATPNWFFQVCDIIIDAFMLASGIFFCGVGLVQLVHGHADTTEPDDAQDNVEQ